MKQQIKYILVFTLLSGIWAKDKKIYISADLEGVVGAVTGEQLGPGGFEYNRFREFMTGEVNAAIKAAKVWCNGQGLSCTIEDRGIGVQVLAGNGTWRTVCYPSNCLQTSLA